MYIGAHVSSSGGVSHSVANALAIGANAFALFTGSPRSYTRNLFAEEEIALFKSALIAADIKIDNILPHNSYLVNLASPKEDIFLKSKLAFKGEIACLNQLGLTRLNFHPGSAGKGGDRAAAVQQLADNLKILIDESEHVCLVIENTAGQGGYLGSSFEELARIIELTNRPERLGVCLDTAHLWAAGYDLRSLDNYRQVMADFDRLIGRNFLKGMHINDSSQPFAGHTDRHASLGEGLLGDSFKWIAQDKYMHTIPLILETPNLDKWPDEIEWLRQLAN
ncbi:MAG: deoxyribonuclease IV [Spirochaetaceae bacterium]|nr:deoxyribonuclease IV [Spirochaetaceae bacterium]